MISKSLSTSEKFAALVDTAGPLAEFCQALYPLVLTHSDDFGRLQGDTFTVKHMCFPTSPRTVAEFKTALTHLHTVGLIVRYEMQSKFYIQIANFEPHQSGLNKRTKSKFPEVPGSSETFQEFPSQENLTELNLTEGKGTEGKGTKDQGPIRVESAKRSPHTTSGTNGKAAPPALTPVNGNGNGHGRKPRDNFAVITKLTHTILAGSTAPIDFASLKADIKTHCAQKHIAYDAEVVGRALESAIAQRRHA